MVRVRAESMMQDSYKPTTRQKTIVAGILFPGNPNCSVPCVVVTHLAACNGWFHVAH